jgi:hypothetical protein
LRWAKRDHPEFVEAEQILQIILVGRAISLEDKDIAVAGKKSDAVLERLLGFHLVQADFPLVADQGRRALGQTSGNKRAEDICPAQRRIVAQKFPGHPGKAFALGRGNRDAKLLDNRDRRAP